MKRAYPTTGPDPVFDPLVKDRDQRAALIRAFEDCRGDSMMFLARVLWALLRLGGAEKKEP